MSLTERLKRRKVLQWALAYIAVAMGVLSVVDMVAEPWDLSAAAQQVIQVLAASGLVVTAVVAWFHGERGLQRVTKPELIVLSALVVLTSGVIWSVSGSSGRSAVHQEAVTALITPGFDVSRIAVLPFENLSGDPETDPFVHGLHEDLMIRLSNVEGLTVTNRGSVSRFAKSSLSIREIAQQLGVATVLQASVQRSGSNVRFTALLIDARTDTNLWAGGYVEEISVENVFAVQARLVERIAAQLAKALTGAQLDVIRKPPTANLEAFELYVRGRDSWLGLTEPTLQRSLAYLSEAVTLDPAFARAHSGLADTYLAMEFVGILSLEEAVTRARESVERALQIDPDLAEARTALGHVFLHEMNGPEAEKELRRAVELNPSFVDGHMFLAMALLDWGRLSEAEASARAALEVDPLSTYGAWGEGLVRLARDDYAGAAEQFQRAIDLDGSWVGHYELAWALSASGDHDRAYQEIEWALSSAAGALAREFGLRSTGIAFKAAAGDSIGARASLARLSRTAEAPFALGLAYAKLGDVDRAFELWLNRTDWTILLPTHFRYGPLLDGLRSDRRYQDVLNLIDEQWRWREGSQSATTN